MDFTIFRAKEEDLIKGCRRGDHHAQQRLFDQYSSRLYGISLRYVKDPMQAEDIVVMTFTKVFERISQFKGEGSFEGWLRRITVNEALGWLRKNRAMAVETDLEQADREPDYNRISDHLEAEDLLKMIGKLPPGYRIVFNMYAIDGYSHSEIAQQLGISENTSKSQLSRARIYLQKLLAETEGHDRTKMQQP
jgi:RNA polymerase sigma factor (sigma-70 family)